MSVTTEPKRRDRHGSVRNTKAQSWHLIKCLRADLDNATDAKERTAIARALSNALAVHTKLLHADDLSRQIKELQDHIGME